MNDIPNIVERGFSTVEVNSIFVPRGYQSHLIALQLWVELELQRLNKNRGVYHLNYRSLMDPLSSALSPFTIETIMAQRQRWIANKLYELDKRNLFFKWLYLKAHKNLDIKQRILLMEELLNMPQFPDYRLPRDCDRKADYLWQRDSIEYDIAKKKCHRFFNGVDFLWLSSLLLTE